ncbi:Aste57867_760 [Aphanomyces stellatus]|uniref:Aste57867_760 protein n=1 Tax=Aphanomyces stellatus TaxID=120398 RepID=A0A485K4L2_9STRA|nr:hypothetical protein As57867_000759 [Aphanomyces stellatus]VFT77984.1 Aste57867_760 [Aphanomyces stellatus]
MATVGALAGIVQDPVLAYAIMAGPDAALPLNLVLHAEFAVYLTHEFEIWRLSCCCGCLRQCDPCYDTTVAPTHRCPSVWSSRATVDTFNVRYTRHQSKESPCIACGNTFTPAMATECVGTHGVAQRPAQDVGIGVRSANRVLSPSIGALQSPRIHRAFARGTYPRYGSTTTAGRECRRYGPPSNQIPKIISSILPCLCAVLAKSFSRRSRRTMEHLQDVAATLHDVMPLYYPMNPPSHVCLAATFSLKTLSSITILVQDNTFHRWMINGSIHRRH